MSDDNDVTPPDSPSALARQAVNAAIDAREESRQARAAAEQSCAETRRATELLTEARDAAHACLRSQGDVASQFQEVRDDVSKIAIAVTLRTHPAFHIAAVIGVWLIAVVLLVR